MVREAHLIDDESRRVADHEEVKQKLRHDVQEAIERDSTLHAKEEAAQVDSVARSLKHKAIAEVGETEREIAHARGAARVRQFVDYLFYVVYGLIGLMIGLELFAAREWAGFFKFMEAVTAPLLAPFQGLMPDPEVAGFELMLSYIVALVVYVLVHQAVRGLLRVLVFRETKV